MPFIIKLGNLAVHTERSVQSGDALASLRGLFEFVQWIDYCYGSEYVERAFDERLIPTEKVDVDTKKIKEQESLLDEKEAQIEALRKQIEQMAAQYTAEKEQRKQERAFHAEDLSEFETRKVYIDVDLKQMGWKFSGSDADVQEEYPVDGMEGIVGKKGHCDYVLFGKDGLPLAVVEAKRTSKDPNAGRKQACIYADCLERKFGRRLFTPAHFDIIIIDESHRSIFKKYRAIFEYFDAMLVGFTATPKTDVDRNTYDFFEMEHGVPTYAYDYETAVNLVFFKKVRSKTKFWQMIGRGTRMCEGLNCIDRIDGEYADKRRFLIFDYCGNFEYFREHKEGYESREAKTLAENIFCKQVKIAFALQESAFAQDNYQAWRGELDIG